MCCVKTKVVCNNANSMSPRGEIGRHKGLKSRGINFLMSLW